MADPNDPDYQEYQQYVQYVQHLKDAHGSTPQGKGFLDTLKDGYQSMLERNMNVGKGATQALTLGHAQGPDMASIGMKEDPVAQGMGQVMGSVVPGEAAAGLTGLAAKGLGIAKGGGMLAGLGRIGLNAGSGAGVAAAGGADPKVGALIGGGSAAIGELANAAKVIPGKLAGLKYPHQREAYLDDPKGVADMTKQLETKQYTPELQADSIDAINKSRQGLKMQGLGQASKLKQLLDGKTIDINPQEFQDTPEIRQIVKDNFVQPAPGKTATDLGYVDLPEKMPIDANDANKLKRMYQGSANYKPGHMNDPVQAAGNDAMRAKGAQLRSAIEGLDPSIKGLNEDMQQGMMLQKDLRQGLKKPITYVSSDAPDRAASLARSDELAPEGVTDFSNKISAAKALAQAHSPSSVMKNLAELFKDHVSLPAMRGLDSVGQNASVGGNSLAALLSELQQQQKK